MDKGVEAAVAVVVLTVARASLALGLEPPPRHSPPAPARQPRPLIEDGIPASGVAASARKARQALPRA